ncbi:MAG: transposase domain-containing protein [Pseudomonadota bacterium]
MTGAWFTVYEVLEANDPGLPSTQQGLEAHAKRCGWTNNADTFRPSRGRLAAQYHESVLPAFTRMRLTAKATPDVEPQEDEPAQADGQTPEQAALWGRYNRLKQDQKDLCERRKAAVVHAVDLYNAGAVGKKAALELAAAKFGFSASSVGNWERQVQPHGREDWAAVLAPKHGGGRERTVCHPDAWAFLKADYLRLEKPSFAACYRRLCHVAKANGWEPVPIRKTLERRMTREVDKATMTLAREGGDKLKAVYPALTRTREHFDAMEAVNIDGHLFDVFVRWTDGKVGRVILVAIQDLYSGKIIAWRLAKSENKETVLLVIGDMVRRHGVPAKMWLDNGRAFASKWVTGKSDTRFKFKRKESDPVGLLPLLGVECHWTTPYSGQSKPIERAFRDMCDDIAKHPTCAGAYTGNSVEAKPENYASKAVPIETFKALVAAEIPRHNARPERRSEVCGGVLSFDDAFAQGLAKRVLPPQRVSPEQERLWLLAAENVKVKKNGEIHQLGNRYWAPEMVDHARETVTVRLDPENLHQPIHIYDLHGAYIMAVPVLEKAGFDSAEAARKHNTNRKAYLKHTREKERLLKEMTLDEVQRHLRAVPPAPEPEAPEEQNPNVVAPVFRQARPKRNSAIAASAAAVDIDVATEDDFMRFVELTARARNNPLAGIGSAYSAMGSTEDDSSSFDHED